MSEKIVKENIQNEKMILDRVIKMHGDKFYPVVVVNCFQTLYL